MVDNKNGKRAQEGKHCNAQTAWIMDTKKCARKIRKDSCARCHEKAGGWIEWWIEEGVGRNKRGTEDEWLGSRWAEGRRRQETMQP